MFSMCSDESDCIPFLLEVYVCCLCSDGYRRLKRHLAESLGLRSEIAMMDTKGIQTHMASYSIHGPSAGRGGVGGALSADSPTRKNIKMAKRNWALNRFPELKLNININIHTNIYFFFF